MRTAGHVASHDVASCSGILRMNNNNTEALYVRGLCKYEMGDTDQAIMHFKRALQGDPDHKRSRTKLKVGTSCGVRRSCCQVDLYFCQGSPKIIACAAHRVQDAHVSYSVAGHQRRIDYPNSPVVHICVYTGALQLTKSLVSLKEQGKQALSSGKYDDALKFYTEALEIDPANQINMAKLYYNRCLVKSKVLHLCTAHC